MATHFKLSKKVLDAIEKDPRLAISLATIGISGTNLAVNSKRNIDSREYQEKQLEAMERLTDQLNRNSDILEAEEKEEKGKGKGKNKSSLILFKLKQKKDDKQ